MDFSREIWNVLKIYQRFKVGQRSTIYQSQVDKLNIHISGINIIYTSILSYSSAIRTTSFRLLFDMSNYLVYIGFVRTTHDK